MGAPKPDGTSWVAQCASVALDSKRRFDDGKRDVLNPVGGSR